MSTSQRLLESCCSIFINYLHDSTVEQIDVNPDGLVYISQTGKKPYPLDERMSANNANQVMNIVANVNNFDLTQDPFLETTFPLNGGRFSGVIAPYTLSGIKSDAVLEQIGIDMPSFSIRCGGNKVYSMDELLASGMISQEALDIIDDLLVKRKSIIISGGTQSGKTYFLNSILLYMAKVTPDDRVLAITDVDELKIFNKNVVVLYATNATSLSKPITMEQMAIHTLRRSPKRIVFGEVRGAEGLEVIKSWATGHSGGILTLHSDEAIDSPARLREACAERYKGDLDMLSDRIVRAVDIIIQIKHDPTCNAGRRVTEIASIKNYSHKSKQFKLNHLYKYEGLS